MANSYNIDSFTTTSYTAEALPAVTIVEGTGRTLDKPSGITKPRTLDKA